MRAFIFLLIFSSNLFAHDFYKAQGSTKKQCLTDLIQDVVYYNSRLLDDFGYEVVKGLKVVQVYKPSGADWKFTLSKKEGEIFLPGWIRAQLKKNKQGFSCTFFQKTTHPKKERVFLLKAYVHGRETVELNALGEEL